MVYQSTAQGVKTVNRLFKADFFGERALLTQEPRRALLSLRHPSLMLHSPDPAVIQPLPDMGLFVVLRLQACSCLRLKGGHAGLPA